MISLKDKLIMKEIGADKTLESCFKMKPGTLVGSKALRLLRGEF